MAIRIVKTDSDEVLRKASALYEFSVSETQTLLSLLELKGLIRESLGQIRLA
jgi:hypothetical protein